jgi:hypothetical protein
MAKLIAKKLLVHTCTLKKPTGLDRDRNPTFSETVLKRVRIGATFQTIRGSVGETKADSMTLVIDAVNSAYETTGGEPTAQVLPAENDVITWESNSFTVRSVTPCYAQGGTPHHWEVTLE